MGAKATTKLMSPMDSEKSVKIKGSEKVKPTSLRARNVTRGVWELGRLHTREAWLCWYPAVWGACLSAGNQEVNIGYEKFAWILFGIWSSVTATHAAGCTWNDLCDHELDAGVERCKTRPLPSGMLTYREAVAAFLAWIPICGAITYLTLGSAGVITFIPIWVLSMIYPYLKRHVSFPQVILGFTIGAAVFPGWASITNSLDTVDQALPLFAATASWVVYFDTFYATQDREDDEKVGVKGLAVLLGDRVWIFLSFLALLQVGFFAVTAMRAHMSAIFWALGLGVWALNLPWHVLTLNTKDRKSGGKIFKANIFLGLYMTAIALAELFFTRVYLHLGEQASIRVLRK